VNFCFILMTRSVSNTVNFVGGAQMTDGVGSYYYFSFQGVTQGGTGQFATLAGGIAGTAKVNYSVGSSRGNGTLLLSVFGETH
jgi:hypothetical protein